jgi:hypothetical protein
MGLPKDRTRPCNKIKDVCISPFQLFMASLPFRAVATIAIRDSAQIRRIKLERHEEQWVPYWPVDFHIGGIISWNTSRTEFSMR